MAVAASIRMESGRGLAERAFGSFREGLAGVGTTDGEKLAQRDASRRLESRASF